MTWGVGPGYIVIMTRFKVLASAAGFALASAGCYTVKPVTFQQFGGEKIEQVWVTTKDSVVFIKNADVSGDKLRGYIDGKYRQLPASDLLEIRVRQFNTGRTLALVGTGVAAAVVVGIMVSGSDDSFDNCAGNPRCEEDTPP